MPYQDFLFSNRVQMFLNNTIALCLGLIPVLHLGALRLVTLLVLVSVILRGRSNFTKPPKLIWPYLLIAQFVVYFTLNAMLYPSMEGNMRHFQRVALESWSMTVVGFGLLFLFVSKNRDFIAHIQRWMPVGLLLSFLIMSYFFFGPQGSRAKAFSTNTLVPPVWFLALTLICFCNVFVMPRRDQFCRGLLFLLAAVMALYSGGRIILAIWFVCGTCLGVYLLLMRPAQTRPLRDFSVLVVALLSCLVAIYFVDEMMGGTLSMRFGYTIEHLSNEGLSSTSFFRLEIWAAASEVIKTYWPLGAGQVNERFLIHEIIARDWWFRAHQTYMSYLIAGGIVALISGLLFQTAALYFCTRTLFPAMLGLFLVPGLSGLTDSIFQSVFSVQLYMTFVFLLSGARSMSSPIK